MKIHKRAEGVMNPKITPDHLGRGAAVYVRQSSMGQVIEDTESQRRQYALAESARTMGVLHRSLSSTTIWVDRGPVRLSGQDSKSSSPQSVRGQWALSFASKPRASRAMVAIGITCLSCVDWWKPASLTSMAFMTHVDRTIVCCLG